MTCVIHHYCQERTMATIHKSYILPDRYANLLPARQDGAIILPATQ